MRVPGAHEGLRAAVDCCVPMGMVSYKERSVNPVCAVIPCDALLLQVFVTLVVWICSEQNRMNRMNRNRM